MAAFAHKLPGIPAAWAATELANRPERREYRLSGTEIAEPHAAVRMRGAGARAD